MKEMKHNMREWLLRASCIVIMMMAMLTSALAQPKGERFDPQEFRAHLEGFISKEAGLTASEGKAFFPLFHEMKEKQRKIQDESSASSATARPATPVTRSLQMPYRR